MKQEVTSSTRLIITILCWFNLKLSSTFFPSSYEDPQLLENPTPPIQSHWLQHPHLWCFLLYCFPVCTYSTCGNELNQHSSVVMFVSVDPFSLVNRLWWLWVYKRLYEKVCRRLHEPHWFQRDNQKYSLCSSLGICMSRWHFYLIHFLLF